MLGQVGHLSVFEQEMLAKQRGVKRLKNEEDYHQS